MLDKTIVCLDGSKLAEEILPYVFKHIAGPESEVILLRVFSAHITIPPPGSTHAMTYGVGSKAVQTHTNDTGKSTTLEPKVGLQLREIEREQGEAKSYLEDLAGRFRSKGAKVKTVVLEGEPSEAILTYAVSSNASLIALTSHGTHGLEVGLLGGVAQFMLKESEIPVLMVKPRGKALLT